MKPGVFAAIVVSVLVLVGVGVFVLSDDSSDEVATNTTQTSQNNDADEIDSSSSESQETSAPAPEEDSTEQLLKADEVAMHSSEDDCWTIIDGMVYDITAYIPRHPGGSTILQACGGDGSSLFNERTTEDGQTVGSGTSHSSGANSQLAGFKIGVLDITVE